MMWVDFVVVKCSCAIDITFFPFDTQICHLKFGSWVYNDWQMYIEFYDNREELDITDYVLNNEWDLVDHSAVINVKYYPCCVESFQDVTFKISIRRISVFYNYVLLLPSMLMSIITPALFWLPVAKTNRTSIGKSFYYASHMFVHIALSSNVELTTVNFLLINLPVCHNCVYVYVLCFWYIFVFLHKISLLRLRL